jgi:hypothetical protein
MSIHKSYFNKNNTLIAFSDINTAKNPVTEIFYGGGASRYICRPTGLFTDSCLDENNVLITGHTRQRINNSFSRFIFDLDITDLTQKIRNKTIILTGGTCGNTGTTHTLKMVNTSFFDKELLNTTTSKGNKRATSFDLVLVKLSGATSGTTCWSEGIGYDYEDMRSEFPGLDDKSYSERPSNWYYATTLQPWNCNGGYTWSTCPGTIIATQTFDNGNENIEFDMTEEINKLYTTSGYTNCGYAIGFVRAIENLTALTESYSVGFFTMYTQTFFEPYLETQYDDYINDARNFFYEGKENCLYLYVNAGGVPTNLDSPPTVQIYNNSGDLLYTLGGGQVTKGVYCVCFSIPCDTYSTPCIFTDRWSNLVINGNCQTEVTNKFTLKANEDYFNIGTNVGLPKHYGYSISGIKRDEKIVNGNIRKVIVSARKEYSTNVPVALSNLHYRIYVKQGTTEVETHPWEKINNAYNQNYFILDTGDMIPNEYYVDIQAISNLEVNTYPQTIKFQIVNQANYFGDPPADFRQ